MNMFLPLSKMSFCFLKCFLCCSKTLVWCSVIRLFFLLFLLPKEILWKNITKSNDREFTVLCFNRFMVSGLYILVFNSCWVYSCMWCQKVPNTSYQIHCLYHIVYSWLLCHRLNAHIGWIYFWAAYSVPFTYVSVFKDSLVWYQLAWYLHLCFFPLRLLWLLRVFCDSL